MNRSRLLTGALALLTLVAPAARAVTGGISISHNIDGDTNTLEVQSGFDAVTFNVHYNITNLGSDTARVQIDMCSPSYVPESGSGGTTNLISCLDGTGEQSYQFVTDPITADSSQGTTGIFTVFSYTAPGIIPDGTQWVVPARIVLDSNPSVPLASTSITVTVRAHPAPAVTKTFYTASAATQPGGSAPGYNVTWQVTLADDDDNLGIYYEAGTSTITDAVPSGGAYVSGTYLAPQSFGYYGPAYAADNLNSNPTITAPGAGVTTVTATLDNMLSHNSFIQPSFLITYWYPASTTTATNTANVTFADGSTASSTGTVYLGAGSGSISKTHYCPGDLPNDYEQGFTSLTAFEPSGATNEECAWDPSAPVQFKVFTSAVQPSTGPSPGAVMPILDQVVTDTLPPQLVLSSLDGIYAATDPYFGNDLSAQWAISGSTDSNCGPSSGTFTTIAANTPRATLQTIRCVRYTGTGFNNATAFVYSATLDDADRDTLDASNGAYQIVTNDAYLSAPDLPSAVSASLDTTFWNSHQVGIVMPGNSGTVGSVINMFAIVSANSTSANSYLGYTNLTFGGTLPMQLDVNAAPYPEDPTLLPVDGNNQPITPTCTFTHQVRLPLPGTPATWQCTFPGYIPSFKQNPYTDPDCTAPYYCSNNSGGDPWNVLYFYLPLKIVSGTQGDYVAFNNEIWSDVGPIASNGYGSAGDSATNPVVQTSYVDISGTSQLTVHKTTPSISVEIGNPISYFIDYSNSGTVTSTNTYVYDLFGTNPTTGDTLTTDFPACNSDIPTLISVQHISGSPASVVEYTTSIPPSVNATDWSTTPPAPLSLATGVRFFLNSAYDSIPGDYSPSDQAGQEEITLLAPNTSGTKLCNMAGIGADGFTVAGTLAEGGPIPVTPICTAPGGCTPTSVPPPNATFDVGPSCGPVNVTLDGSNSTNGTSYAWSENGTVFSTQLVTSANLGLGTHVINLAVSSDYGTANNTVTITIADVTAPVLTCPSSITATVNGQCVPHYTVSATATDNCDPSVTSIQPVVSCDAPTLNAGDTSGTATCTATDSSGNTSATCSIPITVDQSNCQCDSVASFTVGATSDNVTDGNGNDCEFGSLDIPFTMTPGCDQTNPYYLYVTATYVDSNSVVQPLGEGYGYFDYDYNTGTQLNTGNIYLSLQAIADTGPITLTITDYFTGASITTQTIPSVNVVACESAVCIPDGMVFFEDRWPNNGDLDFNDQSIAYNYQFLQDSVGNVDQMLATFNVLSVGATIQNGLYLHLPIPASTDVTIAMTTSADPSTVIQPEIVQGEEDLIITIADNTRSLFPSNPAGYVNTDPSLPTAQQVAVSLLITINDPAGTGLQSYYAPYDLFIAQTGTYPHQIHLSQFGGTDLADPTLFGTGDDGSYSYGPWYINKDGLPFALNVPVTTPWAQETVSIENVYPDVIGFAQGNGPNDWYETTVNLNKAFTQGAGGTAVPTPISFMPPLVGIYGACADPGPFVPPYGGEDD